MPRPGPRGSSRKPSCAVSRPAETNAARISRSAAASGRGTCWMKKFGTDGPLVQVDAKRAELNDGRESVAGLSTVAHLGANASPHFGCAERHGQVVVGAGIERPD